MRWLTLGPPTGKRYSDRRTLRSAIERKAVEPGGIHHSFEIIDETLQRQLTDVPVGQPVASLIISYDPKFPVQSVEKRPPDRTAPIMLQMRQPMPGFYKRITAAAGRIGDPDPVG